MQEDNSTESNTDGEIAEELVSQVQHSSLDTDVVPEHESAQAAEHDDEIVDTQEPSLREALFSILFVSTKLVSGSELSELTKHPREEVEEELERIISDLEESSLGVEIKRIGESYQIRTKPKMSKVIHRMITPKMKRLSKAAAETLAIVAYKQPVSKAEIEAIRGVDALPTLKTLIDGRLIRIVGREDTPGSPALYGTSDFFLERFGLRDLSELPTVREIKELEAESSEIEVSDDYETYDENIGTEQSMQSEDELSTFTEESIDAIDCDTRKDADSESENADISMSFENIDPENKTNH